MPKEPKLDRILEARRASPIQSMIASETKEATDKSISIDSLTHSYKL